MAPPADLHLPKKACHNCRRKRWKCDRSLPVCQKCLSSGTDCLGYGKLFVWNHGVASRGKMMGKTYEEKLLPKKETQELFSRAKSGIHECFENSQSNPFATPVENAKYERLDDTASERGLEGSSAQDLDPIPLPSFGYGTISNDFRYDMVEKEDVAPELPIYWSLVDPLVQDLSAELRYYLYHFSTQLCADMVSYDVPDNNPMRNLIAATSNSPLLLQIIIANSAFHVFNISRDPRKFLVSASDYQEESRPCLVAYYKAATRYGGPHKTSYRDALVAKQEALSLLAQSVATVNESNIDLILATILLFVNYDLIESGKDKWKVHMEGARKLIQMLGTPSYHPHAMTQLRTYLLSEFLVFYILGSTFTFSSTPQLIPDSIDIEPILQYAETNNYLSCPAPLLSLMVKSFNMTDLRDTANGMLKEVEERLKLLLEQALAFDPYEWVKSFTPTSSFENLDQRLYMASAHRSAVCIYLARFIPSTNPIFDTSSGSGLVNLPALADDIIHHISRINPGEVLIKSISWPLFLAGAETDDPAQRTWILNRLDSFYTQMYWGYIHTVKRTLEMIWNCKARATEENPTCWVTEVKERGTEILIA